MPRRPAQNYPPQKFIAAEVRSDFKEDLVKLADEFGVSIQYLIRLCVYRDIANVAAIIRSGEYPTDDLAPSAKLRTPKPKVFQAKLESRQEPPPLSTFVDTGSFPEPAEPNGSAPAKVVKYRSG